MERLPLYAIASGVAALVVAAGFYFRVKAAPEGTPAMARIARYIREGAMAFLVREYKVLAIYAVVVSIVLFAACTKMPCARFGLAAVPVALVPM